MPGVRVRGEEGAAVGDTAAVEATELEARLQSQLEEEVARIFDESIHSDYELVCGKLKILTHTCILKARTKSFYNKLEALSNRNINHKAYDDIYSFISDAYTECDITVQEDEIISYLESNLNCSNITNYYKKSLKGSGIINNNNQHESIDSSVHLSPNCHTSYAEKGSVQSVTSSPSFELTKEYYALVPIDNILSKELKEQDELSTAFQSIIKSQTDPTKGTLRQKPTSLSLKSSHTSKTNLHSSNRDETIKEFTTNKPIHTSTPFQSSITTQTDPTKGTLHQKPTSLSLKSKTNLHSSNRDETIKKEFTTNKPIHTAEQTINISSSAIPIVNNIQVLASQTNSEESGNLETSKSISEKTLDDNHSSDSLTFTEEVSSSSDYQSASYCSPCVSVSGCVLQLNVCKNSAKMANVFTSSDSGLENTESDLTIQHVPNDNGSTPQIRKSSKEEKQRQNEEIFTLESSSLSSETGSWESVFPPRTGAKELCVAFINKERQSSSINGTNHEEKTAEPSNNRDSFSLSLVQKSPFKTASCFIDAACLVDDEETTTQPVVKDSRTQAAPAPSHPVPCHTTKNDISPNDWSESHDDSLDQKDPDSLKRDLSPTIFDMTPITEDSLGGNPFDVTAAAEETCNMNPPETKVVLVDELKKDCFPTKSTFFTLTPNNSIMSIGASRLKITDSEDGDSDSTLATQDGVEPYRIIKWTEPSPLASGTFENKPIVSGAAYVPEEEISNKHKLPKPTNVSSWVVDMSHSPKSEKDNSLTDHKRPPNRNCEILRNESTCSSSQELNCKSRSSVDSDSSERSSHKFYIDLSSLPDPSPPKNELNSQSMNEKKNIFSMYIDIGEKSSIKEMPARLSSSLNAKKVADSPKVFPQPKVKNSSSIKTPKNTSSENLHRNKTEQLNPSKSNKNQSSCNPVNIEQESVMMFEQFEALCKNSEISVNEILAIQERSTKSKQSDLKFDLEVVNEESNQQNQRYKKTRSSHVKPDRRNSSEVFVRLSDLDKPKVYLESCDEEVASDVRMTRSIPDNKWCEGQLTSRSIEVMSSFHSENALSLNRLFPHLKNELSASMPGSLSSRTRSPIRRYDSSNGHIEEHSEVSEMSSVQSSYCRSVVGNSVTEDSQTYSLIGNCESRLGQDLLRMFLEEIAPDVLVEVSGRQFKAHKCILSSRCQYFAGILSGDWVKNAGNVIMLPPFSADVVHFTLCHIYSGVSTIPDSVSVVELATLADMLGLEGLKEVIMFNLKFKYCHNFHKPCQVCVCGVLECLCLSSAYGLDDLYLKCLKWITKYFQKVWPTKAYATLSKDLQDKCYHHQVVNLTIDTLIDTVCATGMILSSLPSSRWAECVARQCRALLSAAVYLAASRLSRLLRLADGKDSALPQAGLHALQHTVADAIERAPPPEACASYAFLTQAVKESKNQLGTKPDLVTSGGDLPAKGSLLAAYANEWRLLCERHIVRSAPRVIDTQAYKDLPQDLRKRLRELGCIPYRSPFASPSPSQNDKTRTPRSTKKTPSRNNLDIEQVRANFVPYSRKPTTQATRAAVKTNPPKIRMTKAQEERAKYNMAQVSQSQELLTNRREHVRVRYDNVKPRYFEPKVLKEVGVGCRVNSNAKVSSSESSRNSSGVQRRRAAAMSQDSLASPSRPQTAEPSTESLSDTNKYATYTKIKHVANNSHKLLDPASYYYYQTRHSSRQPSKIPVYQHHARIDTAQRKVIPPGKTSSSQGPSERRLGSLTMGTKSSMAKVVPKITKDSPKRSAKPTKSKSRGQNDYNPPVISVMERSGTFLKDEPMFVDKPANLDLCQANDKQ